MKTPSQMILFRVDGVGVCKARYALALVNDDFKARAAVAAGVFAAHADDALITQLRVKSGATVLFGDFGSLVDHLGEDLGNFFDSVGYAIYDDPHVIAAILREVEANTRDSFEPAAMDVTDRVFNGTSFRFGGVEKYDTSGEIETPWVEMWEVGLAPVPQEVAS